MKHYLENTLTIEDLNPIEILAKTHPQMDAVAVEEKLNSKENIQNPVYLGLLLDYLNLKPDEDILTLIEDAPEDNSNLLNALTDTVLAGIDDPLAREIFEILSVVRTGLTRDELKEFFAFSGKEVDLEEIGAALGELGDLVNEGDTISLSLVELRNYLSKELEEKRREQFISWLKSLDESNPLKIREIFYQSFLSRDADLYLDFLKNYYGNFLSPAAFEPNFNAIIDVVYDYDGGMDFYKNLLNRPDVSSYLYNGTSVLFYTAKKLGREPSKIIELLEEALKSAETHRKELDLPDYMEHYILSGLLRHLQDSYVEIDDLDKAILYGERALPVVEAQAKDTPTVMVPEELSAFYGQLSLLHAAVNHFEKAIEYSEKQLSLLNDLLEEEVTETRLNHKVNASLLLAESQTQLGEYKKAIPYYIEAAETEDRLFREFHDIEAFVKEGEIDFNLGELYSYLGDYVEGSKWYLNAVIIQKTLCKTFDETRYIEELAKSYTALAYSLEYSDEHERALEFLQKAVDLEEDLNEFKDDPDSLLDLVNIYNTAGGFYVASGDFEDAFEYYDKATKVAKRLADEGDETGLQFYTANLENLAHIYLKRGDYEKALEMYKEVNDNIMKLPEDKLTEQLIMIRNENLETIANFYLSEDKFDEAFSALTEAALARELIDKLESTPETRASLARNRSILGDYFLKTGNEETALRAYEEAADLFSDLEGQPDVDYPLAYVLNRIASIYGSRREYEKAQEVLYHELDVRKRLDNSILNNQRALALCYYWLGNTLLVLGNTDEAYDYYYEALEIRENVILEIDAIDALTELGEVYHAMASVNGLKGNFEEARDYYQHSLETFDKVYERSHDSSILKLNLHNYKMLKMTYEALGDFDGALDCELKLIELENLLDQD